MRVKQSLFLLVVVALILTACGPTPEPQVVEKVVTQVVQEKVVETVMVEGTPEIVEREVTKVIETEVQVEVVVTATPEPAAAVPSEPVPGGTLTLSLGPDFVTFHPWFDVTNINAKPIFFEAPIRISDEGGFEPWLAESFEIIDDGLTVRLKLREGVKFHNGREMTADDVVWSVQEAMSTELGHHLSDRFTTATGAEKVDDYTVDVHYSQITHSALDGIARMFIFPQEAAEDIETTPVGTGPFKLEEWVPGDHLSAVKFEDYWQEGLPYLDGLVVKPIPDPQARMVNLLAGGIDALWQVPLADKALLEDVEGVTLGESPPGFNFYAILFNVNRPPFDNTLVREAMNYAVDRDKINQLALHGEGNMTLLPFAKTSWAYPEDLENYYTYDPEKAKELLAEAGYPDGFETELLIRGASGEYLDIAQVYQQDLAAIGVDAKVVPTELPQYWPLLMGSDFAMVSHGTGDATVDPQGLFEGGACCRPFRNFFGITENTTWFPEYEAAISQAGVELDQEKRKELYHRALEIFLEQGWTIPIAWRQDLYAVNDNIQGFRVDMDGLIWPHEVWMVPGE